MAAAPAWQPTWNVDPPTAEPFYPSVSQSGLGFATETFTLIGLVAQPQGSTLVSGGGGGSGQQSYPIGG